jgi:hypothetical protein
MGRIVYLLDTNILSEPAKKNPDSNVMQRFEEHDGQFAKAIPSSGSMAVHGEKRENVLDSRNVAYTTCVIRLEDD